MSKNGTTKKVAPTSTEPKLSIPAPVRDDPKPSIAEMLAGLKGKKKPATKAKAERFSLELTDEAKDALREWAPAKILSDHFDAALKSAQQRLDDEVVPLWQKAMWESKTQPQNPTLKVTDDKGLPDIEGMIVIQERFKIQTPDFDDDADKDTVVNKIVDSFVRVGINPEKARRLVVNEFVIREEKTIPLTELMEGKKQGKDVLAPSAAGRSAAEKLIMTIATGVPLELTNEEQEALIVTTAWQVSVKGGFLERACSYCDTFEQLRTILNLMVKPTVSHRGAKVSISKPGDKNRRLIGVAADILGAMTDNDDDDD